MWVTAQQKKIPDLNFTAQLASLLRNVHVVCRVTLIILGLFILKLLIEYMFVNDSRSSRDNILWKLIQSNAVTCLHTIKQHVHGYTCTAPIWHSTRPSSHFIDFSTSARQTCTLHSLKELSFCSIRSYLSIDMILFTPEC